MLPFFLSLVLSVCVIQYYWKNRNYYKHAFYMNGPLALPLLGNICMFSYCCNTQGVLDMFVKQAIQFPPPVRIWFGPILLVLVGTPEELERIANQPHLFQKSSHYEKIAMTIPNGIFATKNMLQWKTHRKIIISSLNQKALNSYVEVFHNTSIKFAKNLEKYAGGGEFNVLHLALEASVDNITKTILDVNGDEVRPSEVSKLLQIQLSSCGERISNPILYFDFIYNNTQRGHEFFESREKLRTSIKKLIAKRRERYRQMKANNEFDDGKSIKSTLDLLVEASEEQNILTDEQICDEATTLIFGGSDSSANMNSFCLMLLGMHQDIQSQVFEEIRNTFGENNRPINCEDLSELKLLERVIKETLRLFPVGPLLGRTATADVDMNTYTIPKGADVVINIYRIHRDPNVWEEPTRFNPDRFLPENFSKIKPYAYVPFSAGMRNCVGGKFAIMAMKCTIANILRKYKVFCNVKTVEDIQVKTEVMLTAVDGNYISLERRIY